MTTTPVADAETAPVVLVTGATGNTGSALLCALGERDVSVRAMVRSESAHLNGLATPAVADFDDAAAVAQALAGVHAAYLVTPSSDRAEEQQSRFVELAADAGVGRLVLLSQFAAAADSPVRFLRYHAAVEQRILDLGLDYTFLRPNLFFQGLLAFAPSIAANGRIAAPIGDAAVSALDVRDIAAVAAAALTEPAHSAQTYTLTGPEAVTHSRIAAVLSGALGRPIEFTDATPQQFADSLQGILPPWQLAGLLEDYAHYRRGEAAAVTTTIADVTGRPAIGLAQFASDHATAFTAPQ